MAGMVFQELTKDQSDGLVDKALSPGFNLETHMVKERTDFLANSPGNAYRVSVLMWGLRPALKVIRSNVSAG